jgi:hypothetical protein
VEYVENSDNFEPEPDAPTPSRWNGRHHQICHRLLECSSNSAAGGAASKAFLYRTCNGKAGIITQFGLKEQRELFAFGSRISP